MGFVEKIRDYALSKGYYEAAGDDYDDDDEADYGGDDDDEDYSYGRPADRERYSRPEKTRERAPLDDVGSRRAYSGVARIPASKVVSIQTNVQLQVVISYPETIDEAGVICDYIKSNKTVVINLDSVKHDAAQRIVDFLGGVVFALEGDIQYVSNKIFVVAPKNVDITGQFKEELKANGLLFNFKTSFR